MKNNITFITIILFSINIFSQTCSSDSLIVRDIKASNTDSNIDFEVRNHQVYLNPDCLDNNKLVLHLGGSFGNPINTTYFPTLAANNGFKVLNLKYPNSVSATGACSNSSYADCFWKYRQEIIFGTDTSSEVTVDSINCIYNRVLKLLVYLDNNYPSENWDSFLTNSNEINWTNIIVSGHSQGGGHAAYLAKRFETKRVLLFASPNDYSNTYSAPAPWINNNSATPDSLYFAFGNLYDDVVNFDKQYEIWDNLNLLSTNDSTNVDLSPMNYNNSNVLYTKDTSSTSFSGNHGSVVVDDNTPLFQGVPIFIPVWKYLLGIESGFSNLPESSSIITKVFPNPTKDNLFIESQSKIKNIIIYDASGKLLKQIKPNKRNFTVDLKSYNGLLFLKLITFKDKEETIQISVY